MPTHKFSSLAKEALSLMAYCEEGLSLIGKHIATRAYFGEGPLQPGESVMEGQSPQAQLHLQTAKQTRAFAEEVRDPEIRRLLCALADRYDQMAIPEGPHQR
jgi:hypothetical protein